MEICGGDGGAADEQTCSVTSPMALIAYKGGIYASSLDSTQPEILKIQGETFRDSNKSEGVNCWESRRIRHESLTLLPRSYQSGRLKILEAQFLLTFRKYLSTPLPRTAEIMA